MLGKLFSLLFIHQSTYQSGFGVAEHQLNNSWTANILSLSTLYAIYDTSQQLSKQNVMFFICYEMTQNMQPCGV